MTWRNATPTKRVSPEITFVVLVSIFGENTANNRWFSTVQDRFQKTKQTLQILEIIKF